MSGKRWIGLTFALLIVTVALVQAYQSHMFAVQTKSWQEVPEKYRSSAPPWKTCVGVQWNPTRKTHSYLYLQQVGKMGWKYVLRDEYGRTCLLFAGQDWRWSPGDRLIISGVLDEAGVFIPQGERCYVR